MRSCAVSSTLLVGNNLAVLVAAVQLGGSGHDVVLLDDGKAAGGHFRGMRLGEHDFDLGMVLLEKAPASSTSAPSEVQRTDWARSASRVGDWIEGHVEVRRTPTPEVLLDGRRWPDHLLANRLEVFAGQPAPPLLPRDDPRHPAHKAASSAYDSLSYADAARLSHGEDLHERTIEPFLRKLGVDGQDLLARHHRAAWVPLYWPETLAAACEGRSTGLEEYPFWATSRGFTGELVRALERRVEELPTVTVHSAPLEAVASAAGRLDVRTQDGRSWSGASAVVGLAPPRLHELLGTDAGAPAPAASVVLAFSLVRAAAATRPVSCLSVVDEDVAAYRVTDQDALAGLDPEWHRVVVEATPTALDRVAGGRPGEERLLAELRTLLGVEDTDDARLLRSVTARGAVALPTRQSVQAAAAGREALTALLPGSTLTGALLGFGMASMNEQILQGITIAEERA